MNEKDVTPTAEVTNQNPETVLEVQGEDAVASESQISANRRNALKSTGPRTVKGKAASRMNAMRHGILSSALVVRGLRIREHEEEFKALREQCWECLAPVGRMEEMLVDKIVTAQWRMRRALMAETGEIVKSVDGGRQHRADRDPLSQWIFMDPTRDASVAMTKSSAGLEYRTHILETVRENVRKDGELTEKTLEWVRRRFMDVPNNMTRALEGFRKTYVANPEGLTPEDLKLRHQTAVDRYVEATLGWQAKLNTEHRDREDKQETAGQAADVLPSSEVLEKIMRYEGSLDRQLYRAMNQLERLQRRREGEDVKPPLMMDVMK
ncbi:MAG TPA: hypothetical protein VNL17_01760 [Verrucomicrobiae bacterium]|nr:hypothetical protein [Verrucomicrobiae bacterium]